MRYGLFVKDAIPFFVFDFGGMSLDASANIFKVKEEYRDMVLKADGNLSNLWMVDIRHYILKGIRTIGIDSVVMHLFRETLKVQSISYQSIKEVDVAIGNITANYDTSRMIRESKMITLKRDKR